MSKAEEGNTGHGPGEASDRVFRQNADALNPPASSQDRLLARDPATPFESLYRDLLQSMRDAILLLEGDCIVDCNVAAETLLARSAADLIGASADHLFLLGPEPGQRAPAFSSESERAGRGERISCEGCCHLPDGRQVSVEISLQRCAFQGRNLVLALIRDVTTPRQVAQELRHIQTRYYELFASMSSGVAVYATHDEGQSFSFVDINRACERIENVRREDLLGKDVVAVFPGVRDFGLLEVFRNVWRTGKPQRHPVSQYQDDRITGWRDNSVHKLPTGEVVAVYDDVTEQMQMIEALRQSEESFRALAENASDGIVIANSAGRHVYANPRMADLTGYTGEQLLAIGFRELAHPDELQRVAASFAARMNEHETARQYETAILRKDERSVPVEVTGAKTVWNGEAADIVIVRDISERKRVEAALKDSEERYRSLFADSPIALFEGDCAELAHFFARLRGQGIGDFRAHFTRHPEDLAACVSMIRITDLNRASLTLHEADDPADFQQGLQKVLAPESYAAFQELIIALAEGQLTFETDGIAQTFKGNILEVSLRLTVVRGCEPPLSRVLVSIIDMTERRALERQLRHAQKMEAIARLAGGVAHDFNNLLTVINGFSSMLLDSLAAEDPNRADLLEIRNAGRRAARLTHRLLAFGRPHMSEAKIVDLNDLLRDVGRLLKPILGEFTELVTLPSEKPATIQADPDHIEQILVNLAINAKDAMPDGGTITIEIRHAHAGSPELERLVGIAAESHVVLSVRDSGCGMDREVLSKAFEPYFTTKPSGKGTGLGLSTVYAIVKQYGGVIDLHSAPDAGTRFDIFFPRSEAEPQNGVAEGSITERAGGRETILLVEDEVSVLKLATRILQSRGYVVIAARDGGEALRLADGEADAIDLVLTDVVMPSMSGPEFVCQLRALRPSIRVLYTSGYADAEIARLGVPQEDAQFIQKPFAVQELADRVRAVLDTP